MMTEAAPVFRRIADLKRFASESGAKAIVLTNGCFDPLHVGHVRYLAGAKEHADFLVVAINDDDSTRALKGPSRPVLPADDRAQLVAGVEVVDAVLIFSAPNVSEILQDLRPAYHAKGTDYTEETVPELDTSRRLGIETIIVGDPKTHASREVVDRIKAKAARKGGRS